MREELPMDIIGNPITTADDRNKRFGHMSHDYGRRIEMNRSWTIYHVFTGIPAEVGTRSMVGLSKSDATDGNSHNVERRKASFSHHASPGSCAH
jgi:hypothetical protein